MTSEPFSTTEKRLLDGFQRDFPLESRPFAAIGRRLGIGEREVLDSLGRFSDRGIVSRVGAVVAPHRVGHSTLAAMAVPEARLDEVADLVSALPEVNHNYEREHRFNLWFVVTAPDRAAVQRVLDEIESRTGLAVLDLPLVEAYRLDLGFPLQWA